MVCNPYGSGGGEDIAFGFGSDALTRNLEAMSAVWAAPWMAMMTVAMEMWSPVNYQR